MRVGHFTINTVIEFQVLEGSRVRFRTDDLDKAIKWADDEIEADREAEERQQWGDGRNGDIADRRWKLRNEEVV